MFHTAPLNNVRVGIILSDLFYFSLCSFHSRIPLKEQLNQKNGIKTRVSEPKTDEPVVMFEHTLHRSFKAIKELIMHRRLYIICHSFGSI